MAWLAVVLPAAAQGGDKTRWTELADTIFRVYGPDDGLSTSSVTAFAEDGAGFLWIGSQSGLSRWDGYNFRVYHANSADTAALKNDFIWCLATDRRGRVWVGTNSGGVSRYDETSDHFVTYSIGTAEYGNYPVRTLLEDEAGGVWAGTDHGLYHLDAEGRIVGQAAGLTGDQVLALMRDQSGKIWAGTKGGLARQVEDLSFSGPPINADGDEAPAVRALHQTSDGRIWVGVRDHGLFRLSAQGRLERASAQHLSIITLAEAEPGVIWAGTETAGIVAFDTASGRESAIRHDPTRPSSLPHDLVFALHRDHSGLIWAGTYSGLAMHDPTQSAIQTIFGGSNHTEGLASADVLATLVTRNGMVWTAYLTGGVDILDPAGHRVKKLRHNAAHPTATVPADNIHDLAMSQDGTVLLGTYHGIYRSDPRGETVRSLPLSGKTPYPTVLSMLPDVSGVWIGTQRAGLWHLDPTSGESHHLATTDFDDQWISALAAADAGRLWVGSFHGLYLFDPSSGRVERSLEGIVSALVKDRRGRLWAATLDGGIAVEERDAGGAASHFRRIRPTEGLPSLDVSSLIEDHNGTLWAAGGAGMISRVDPETLTVRTLQRGDGVGLRGFTMNSSSVTPQGEILVGGDGGMLVIHPDRLHPRGLNPPIVVTDLRIGGQQLRARTPTPLTIEPDANSLSVEFAALDYSAPERNLYAYRLDGFDKDWVPTNASRRLASYTNLPPGDYVLRLRGSNRDGAWSEKTLALTITVNPAWYQTFSFRTALVLSALLGIWLLVRVRTSYLRHRQIVLERQVAERTEELGRSLREVAESRTKVASLLDTSGQGFFSFGTDLIVQPDYSRACQSMLDCVPAGRRADELMFGRDSTRAELFRKIVAGALASEDLFKRDLFFSLLPVTIDRRGRILKTEYRRLENADVMVVLTDITEEHRLSRKVESERLHMAMIVMAVTESRDFFDALESYRQFFRRDLAEILSARSSPLAIHQQIYRQVHTFKGTMAQFSFHATPKVLHELEEGLSALKRQPEPLNTGKIVEMVLSADFNQALEADLDVLRNALGQEFLDHGRGVFLPAQQARQLRMAAERLLAGETLHAGSAETRALFAEFRDLDKILLADALALYVRVIDQLAQRLDKEIVPLAIEGGGDLRLDPERYGPFLRSLIHVFRNAVVHGIEDPEHRLANGKGHAGGIGCVVRREASHFTLMIADDGAGIDIQALRERAAALGLMSPEEAAALSHDEAISLIFTDEISAHDHADELAGRGIGLAAVRAEVIALGGEVSVVSSPGQGTSFVFSFPWTEDIEIHRFAV